MKSIRRAFTLIELLVVIAIIAILAAILFPVFAQAKLAAKGAAWMSSHKQVALGAVMYYTDNDDRMPFVNSGGVNLMGWGFGHPDYIWGELVYPYIKNWQLFRCPMDGNQSESGISRDPYENPVPSTDPNIHYYWMSRSGLGYNYDFLCPWIFQSDPGGYYVGSKPIGLSEVGQSANTIAFADTIWYRDAGGAPTGGGNWVVEAPCIYDTNGRDLTPSYTAPGGGWGFKYNYGGWQLFADVGYLSWLEFGGMWSWRSKVITTSYVDGHSKAQSLGVLTAGCNVKSFFAGDVYDTNAYLWDLEP